MVVPEKVQIQAEAQAKFKHLHKPQRLLREFFDKEGFDYVDLLGPLLAEENPPSHYFEVDSHMNAKGHEYVARQLAKHLLEGSLIPDKRREGPQ